jgi:hypothetical protein
MICHIFQPKFKNKIKIVAVPFGVDAPNRGNEVCRLRNRAFKLTTTIYVLLYTFRVWMYMHVFRCIRITGQVCLLSRTCPFILLNEVRQLNETLVNTDAGNIVVSHTMTLGDVIISTLLVLILFVMIFNNIKGRF